jgi:hypothetical protein
VNCGHCRLFFIELHRRCTISLNGECDCPICQGVCDCRRPVVETLRLPDTYSDRVVDINSGRQFGQRRK